MDCGSKKWQDWQCGHCYIRIDPLASVIKLPGVSFPSCTVVETARPPSLRNIRLLNDVHAQARAALIQSRFNPSSVRHGFTRVSVGRSKLSSLGGAQGGRRPVTVCHSLGMVGLGSVVIQYAGKYSARVMQMCRVMKVMCCHVQVHCAGGFLNL